MGRFRAAALDGDAGDVGFPVEPVEVDALILGMPGGTMPATMDSSMPMNH